MRITNPKCPCGGEYAVKDGSIVCTVCGDPIHSKPLRKYNAANDGDKCRPKAGEIFEDEDGDFVFYNEDGDLLYVNSDEQEQLSKAWATVRGLKYNPSVEALFGSDAEAVCEPA